MVHEIPDLALDRSSWIGFLEVAEGDDIDTLDSAGKPGSEAEG